MTSTPYPDAPTEPSKGDNGLTQAARSLLTELQSIMLGDEATPDPEAMSAICVALDRFRAAGVREAIEQAAQLAEAIVDPPNASAQGHGSYIATAIRFLQEPTHD